MIDQLDRGSDRSGKPAAVAAARRRGSELKFSNCGEGYTPFWKRTAFRGVVTREIKLLGKMEKVEGVVPLPMELDPQNAFQRLFGSGATPELRAQRMRQSRSILDRFSLNCRGRRRTWEGPIERTVDQYTEEVREIERRIELAAESLQLLILKFRQPSQVFRSCSTTTSGRTGTLSALAFQAEITRVATLLGARDLTVRRIRSRRASFSRKAEPASASTAVRTIKPTRPRSKPIRGSTGI